MQDQAHHILMVFEGYRVEVSHVFQSHAFSGSE